MRKSWLAGWEVQELEERGVDPGIIQGVAKSAMSGMRECGGCGSIFSIKNGSCPFCALKNGTGLERVKEPLTEYMKGYRKRQEEAEK